MKKFIAGLVTLLMLSACGTHVDGPLQEVTLLTPGAEHAQCTLSNADYRLQMVTGETRKIMQSEHDLNVECLAPGNRQKSIVVENHLADEAKLNVLNAGTGLLLDYHENAMFAYPETITVDFAGMEASIYEKPQYHSQDTVPPSALGVESYAPSVPLNNRDFIQPTNVLLKKERVLTSDIFNKGSPSEGIVEAPVSSNASSSGTPLPLPPANTVSPVPVGSSADELTRSMNPHVFSK